MHRTTRSRPISPAPSPASLAASSRSQRLEKRKRGGSGGEGESFFSPADGSSVKKKKSMGESRTVDAHQQQQQQQPSFTRSRPSKQRRSSAEPTLLTLAFDSDSDEEQMLNQRPHRSSLSRSKVVKKGPEVKVVLDDNVDPVTDIVADSSQCSSADAGHASTSSSAAAMSKRRNNKLPPRQTKGQKRGQDVVDMDAISNASSEINASDDTVDDPYEFNDDDDKVTTISPLRVADSLPEVRLQEEEEETEMDIGSLEKRIQSQSARTVLVHFPGRGNLSAERAKLIPTMFPCVFPDLVERYFLSYFHLIEFDSPEGLRQYRREVVDEDPESEATLYCGDCAFALESTVQEHLPKCRSDDNRDLNKLFKVSSKIFPDFTSSADGTVLLVRTFRCAELADADAIGRRSKHILSVSFSNTFFLRFREKEHALAACKVLHGHERHGLVTGSASPLEAQLLTHTPGYRSAHACYAARAGGRPGGGGGSSGEQRETLARSLTSHEVSGDEVGRAILVLGSALRLVTKGPSSHYVNRMKKLLGCQKFVSGNVSSTPSTAAAAKGAKGAVEFGTFGLAFYASEEAMRSALQNCQLHFLTKEHINIFALPNFLASLETPSNPSRVVDGRKKKSVSKSEHAMEHRVNMEFKMARFKSHKSTSTSTFKPAGSSAPALKDVKDLKDPKSKAGGSQEKEREKMRQRTTFHGETSFCGVALNRAKDESKPGPLEIKGQEKPSGLTSSSSSSAKATTTSPGLARPVLEAQSKAAAFRDIARALALQTGEPLTDDEDDTPPLVIVTSSSTEVECLGKADAGGSSPGTPDATLATSTEDNSPAAAAAASSVPEQDTHYRDLGNELLEETKKRKELELKLLALEQLRPPPTAAAQAERLREDIEARKREMAELDSQIALKRQRLENFYLPYVTVKLAKIDEKVLNARDLETQKAAACSKKREEEDAAASLTVARLQKEAAEEYARMKDAHQEDMARVQRERDDSEGKLLELTRTLAERDEKCCQMEKENQVKEAELERQRRDSEEKQRRIATLERSVAAHIKVKENAIKSATLLTEKLHKSQEEVTQLTSQKSRKVLTSDCPKSPGVGGSEKDRDLSEKLEAEVKKNEELAKKNAELTRKSEESRRKLVRSLEQTQEANTQLAATMQQKAKALKDSESIRSELASARDELESLKREERVTPEMLRDQLELLRTRKDGEVDSQKSRVKTLEEALEEATKDLGKQRQDCASLDKRMEAAAEASAATIREMEEKLSSTAKKADESSAESEAARAMRQALRRLTGDFLDTWEDLATSVKSKTSCSPSSSSLQSAREALKRQDLMTNGELIALTEQLLSYGAELFQSLQDEAKETQQRLEQQLREAEEAKARAEELHKTQAESLEKRLAQLGEERDAKAVEVEEAKVRIDRLAREKDNLEKSNNKLRQTRESTMKTMTSVQAECSETIQKKEEEISMLKAEVAKAQSDKISTDKGKFEQENQALSAQLTVARNQIKEFETTIRVLQNFGIPIGGGVNSSKQDDAIPVVTLDDSPVAPAEQPVGILAKMLSDTAQQQRMSPQLEKRFQDAATSGEKANPTAASAAAEAAVATAAAATSTSSGPSIVRAKGVAQEERLRREQLHNQKLQEDQRRQQIQRQREEQAQRKQDQRKQQIQKQQAEQRRQQQAQRQQDEQRQLQEQQRQLQLQHQQQEQVRQRERERVRREVEAAQQTVVARNIHLMQQEQQQQQLMEQRQQQQQRMEQRLQQQRQQQILEQQQLQQQAGQSMQQPLSAEDRELCQELYEGLKEALVAASEEPGAQTANLPEEELARIYETLYNNLISLEVKFYTKTHLVTLMLNKTFLETFGRLPRTVDARQAEAAIQQHFPTSSP